MLTEEEGHALVEPGYEEGGDSKGRLTELPGLVVAEPGEDGGGEGCERDRGAGAAAEMEVDSDEELRSGDG